ncbi:GNAT family N-acetyltransferase [Massilia scottii]|uniref:GNAT family N-acetyltransferase n=1 Tax=Massilia scottii TaxID=3057166 RepID=UPI0027967898|nr:GNAT family N-acetyltransferase [Massilia sp. CCM 9029]MDQ1830922.1 GNAT family N-acetyltransferase [Massilia sp. CCM 9029]
MIAIAACDPDSLDARTLIEELSAALAAITGDSGKASFSSDDARVARSLFVVARGDAGELLGCAALRPLDGNVGEVKRMFARPGASGVGAALLAHVERAAQGFGYHQLWLETRKVNTRALAFYAKHGYGIISNYGKYVGRDDAVCLGKLLRDDDASFSPLHQSS